MLRELIGGPYLFIAAFLAVTASYATTPPNSPEHGAETSDLPCLAPGCLLCQLPLHGGPSEPSKRGRLP